MRYDSGDTAWLLICTALVLFMTPGLAFFYGGMVRSKNVLTMLMQNVVCIAVVSVTWGAVGFSLAFGPDAGGGLVGTLRHVGLAHLDGAANGTVAGFEGLTVPPLIFAAFQCMFAVITAALITGAVADRVRFGGFVVFIAAWSVLVYPVLAHWVFSPGGWLFGRGLLDFAGGTVVEVNCGAAAVAAAVVVGRRRGWPREAMAPHSLPLTLLGAGILWFGWFGFNAGSALHADGLAASALVNTHYAGVGGLLAWIGVERFRIGHATTLGAASGAVAGLVAITPSAGYLSAPASFAVGLAAGAVCAFAVTLKYRVGVDDALDVFGVHLVGGVVGTLAIGLLATGATNPAVGTKGLLLGGGAGQLGKQALGIVVAMVFSFTATWLLATLVQRTIGLRVDPESEVNGLDSALHAESAYDHAGGRF
ncbi:MAG: ammonium transporter, Amt family [Frankiaceae bacterium]|nr:ammonium transporter, Amt family [Frankiaceae bacterium]